MKKMIWKGIPAIIGCFSLAFLLFSGGCGGGDGGAPPLEPPPEEPVAEPLAIVDVFVSNTEDFSDVPPGFTGLRWGQTCTNPYVPDLIGEKLSANDVRVGIRGNVVGVWVKYDFVPVTSNQPVLVDYEVFHYDVHGGQCPALPGWERAKGGDLRGFQGSLTWDTLLLRINYLCVLYKPMNQTDTFITNVGLSYTGNDTPQCPAVCEANGASWPMTPGSGDIQRSWENHQWLFLCHGGPGIM